MNADEARRERAWVQRDRYWYRPIPGTQLVQVFRFEKDGSIRRYQLALKDNTCSCQDRVVPCKHSILHTMHMDGTILARMKFEAYMDSLEVEDARQPEAHGHAGGATTGVAHSLGTLRKEVVKVAVPYSHATCDFRIPPRFRQGEFPQVGLVPIGCTDAFYGQGFLTWLVFRGDVTPEEQARILQSVEAE